MEADFTVPKAQLGDAWWLSWPLSRRRPARADGPFLCCPVKRLAWASGSLSCLLPLLLPWPCPFPDSPWLPGVGGGGTCPHPLLLMALEAHPRLSLRASHQGPGWCCPRPVAGAV